MAGTTAFVWVLLGGCGVAVVALVARAKVDIARITAQGAAQSAAPDKPRRS
ncbi:hypothetical protein [Streptomyces sp. NBC_01233]|uniref:hypothetical protein n=1 Tax=Streptomyces sp. NBC_01233 TaxID=2903787 RepID=UPI002E14201F|nr:hypothetical protein OG332_24165 [Streptomyces sp. NBC_01233]